MKRFLLPLASLVLLGGCAGLGSVPAGGVLAQVDDIATGSLQTRPAVVEMDGEPALLYASKGNRIVFQRGKERLQLDGTAPVTGGNRFQLQRQDKHLHALWWSHQDAKNLYFSSSENGGKAFAPVSIVNDANGVLAPFSLLRGPGGVVGMTYLDERLPMYQAYFNRSTDYGRTWAKPDVRLDLPDGSLSTRVQDPQSVESGNAWVTAWVDVVKVAGANRYRVLSRRSDDAGLQWSPQQELFSSDKLISSLAVEAQGSHIVIAADEHDRGIVALASPDQGRSWKASGVLPGTEDVSNSGIGMTVAGDRAHLVWMQDRKGEKTRIMHASLGIAQGKWIGAVQRLDVKTIDNTRSLLPVVLAAPKGQVVVAWVDYRDIRPNIYASVSFDQGGAWSKPQAMMKPGEVSVGLPALLPWGDEVAIGYEVYPADREMDGKFVLKLMPLGDVAKALPGFAAQPQVSDAERKSRLEQRVKALWDYRAADNYEPTYEMFDFAFKAVNPKQSYLNGTGLITYQRFSVEDIAIQGNEAHVKMKIKYEVKPTPLPSGKLLKMEPTEAEATNIWVWVGNEWYMVYNPAYGQALLKY